MTSIKLFLILWIISYQSCIGQNKDSNNTKQQILDHQISRFTAMIEEDVDILKSLLADDLTYGHTKGSTETKSGFIETVKSKRIDYLSFNPKDVTVRIYDNVALLTGFIDVKVIYKSKELIFTTRFLEVQRKVDDNWLLAAWQPVVYEEN